MAVPLGLAANGHHAWTHHAAAHVGKDRGAAEERGCKWGSWAAGRAQQGPAGTVVGKECEGVGKCCRLDMLGVFGNEPLSRDLFFAGIARQWARRCVTCTLFAYRDE